MKNLLRVFICSIVLVGSMGVIAAAEEGAFDNPSYYRIMTPYLSERDYDTIATLEYKELPQYMVPTTVDIRYVARHDDSLGIDFVLGDGALCHCVWDSLVKSIDGEIKKGDTLRFDITLSPRVVGTSVVWILPRYRGRSDDANSIEYKIRIIVSLDEHGKPNQDPAYKVHYGPTWEASKDSVFFVKDCYLPLRAPNTTFEIELTVTPNFSSQGESRIRYDIIPHADFPGGVSYSLDYSDVFEIKLNNENGWPVASRGDTLTIVGVARPLKPGVGRMILHVYGNTGGDTRRDFVSRYLRLIFTIDESLYNVGNLSVSHSVPDTLSRSDLYRLDELGDIRTRYSTGLPQRLDSKNFGEMNSVMRKSSRVQPKLEIDSL